MFEAQTMAGTKTNAVGSVQHIQKLKVKCTITNNNKKETHCKDTKIKLLIDNLIIKKNPCNII